ncbi:hypothetical protein [Apilactobacillus timberlakei]|uniref:hypothetical protein n=1 Tax=Apilactobacillus timberlakei TaxID=2008380 RepID=UPI00112C5613|nr:hypothetical protein [Apilactobacillus timberlakei]TPR16287.1 hypothetical protein DYZ95_07925 [Apilactobacillus timberlakei]TPR21542.1 hypothetical protein DY083_05845 [Apilactobacillus timberlakei]
MNKNFKKWVSIIFIALFFALIVFTILMNVTATNSNNKAKNQLKIQQEKLDSNKNNYQDKFNDEFNQYKNNLYKSKDAKLSSITLNNENYSKAKDSLDKFLSSYFTYKNQKTFNERKDYLLSNDLITKSFANSDKFDSPKDSTGNSYIDASGLTSTYKGNSIYSNFITNGKGSISVYALVTFDSQYRDSWVSTATNLYKIDYNMENMKINGINKISTIENKGTATRSN